MPISKLFQHITCILLFALMISSCKKDPTDKDEYLVNANEVGVLNSEKTKLKSDEQFVAILHANLFQKALSANDVFDVSQCIESMGDKELAREVVISNFMNKPGIILPSDEAMRADIEGFIVEAYNRFLVRDPTEAEKAYFKNYIVSNPNVNAEIVYFSFALSNEYLYY